MSREYSAVAPGLRSHRGFKGFLGGMAAPMASLPAGPGTLRAFRFVRQPFEFLDACARRYGDWFSVRFPGIPPFVFTSDPDAIREIFSGDPEQLHAGEANAPLGADRKSVV